MSTNGQDGQGPISTPMVAALEQAWAAIRQHNPEVPQAVIVLGAGSTGSKAGTLRLGHFAAMRWHNDTTDNAEGQGQLAEVFVGGEGLRRGAVDVLGTLLHEAAHALADVRGIKDTSRQGRYHNTRFKQLAEELGIEVSKDPRIGWSPTAVPATTRQRYTATVAALTEALRLFRAPEQTTTGTKSKNPPPCVCECGRRIRVATSVLEAGPITCGVCGTDFEPDQQD
ncbi:MAG: hypothetical protein ACRDQB_06115 [Thermocrispum sp.]